MSRTFLEHTGEVELQLEAATLSELFIEAGLGLAELLGADLTAPVPDDSGVERVELTAADDDALLVDWLNELVYLSETRARAFTRLELTHVGAGRLSGTVSGLPLENVRTQVKAATYHRLHIERRAEGFVARVVLDI